MKSVKTDRYQKRREPAAEAITFPGSTTNLPHQKKSSALPKADRKGDHQSERTEQPSNGRILERTSQRPVERETERTDERSYGVEPANSYLIQVPEERIKDRHSFNIFKDQKLALDQLQMAIRDVEGKKPNLGELVQRALDSFIRERAHELPNVRVVERADNHSNDEDPVYE